MAEAAPSLLGGASGAVLNYALLCLSYILLTKVWDWTASVFFLGGLTRLQLVDPSTQLQSPSTQPAPSKKQEKKLLRSMQLLKASTYNIMMSLVQQRHLARLEFFETFNTLMLCGAMVVVNIVGVMLMQHVLGVGKALLPLNFAVAMVLYLVLTAYQMEWAHNIIKLQDKWGMAVFGTIGAAVAASLLSLAPPTALGLDASAAAQELTEGMVQLMKNRFKDMPDGALAGLTPASIRAALVVILTVLGGAISGLLLAPGLRFGRLVLQALFPPSWSREYIVYSSWERALIRAGFTLPFLVVALWVTPLVAVLPLPIVWLPAVRLLVVLTTAAVLVAILRPLVQSFLFTALLNWYLVRHSSTAMDESTRGSVLRRNIHIVDAQTCKVAVQMSIMPCLLSVAAGVLALKSFHIGKLGEADGQPSQAWQLAAGFVAWWACLWWCLYSMMSVMFVRLGVLSTNKGV